MKRKLLWLVLFISVGSISFADAVVERRFTPRRSAIQSTNMVFSTNSTIHNDSRYDFAIQEIKNKIKQTPYNYVYNVSLVTLYIKSRNYDNAFDELVFLNNLAKQNKLNESALSSLTELQKLLINSTRYYTNSDLNTMLSMVSLILQDMQTSEQSLLKSVSSKFFIPLYQEVFNTSGNYQLAIELADKVLIKKPTLLDLRKLKATYLIQLNRTDEAIKELNYILTIDDKDNDSRYNLYNLLSEKQVSEKELIARLFPLSKSNLERAYSDLSYLLLNKNHYSEAQSFAQKLVEQYPDNPNGYIVLSEIYRNQGKLEESYDVLKMVRDRANDSETVAKYNVLLAKLSDQPVKEADSLMNNGLYSQALNVLEIANQESLYVILGQARANYFLKNTQKAFDLLNKAMTLYPKNPDVFYYFAYIFYEEKDYESARKYINQALKMNSQHSFSLKLLDVLNNSESKKYYSQIMDSFEAQNYTEAMRLINEALKINKKDSVLYYYQGLTYIAMNDYAIATAPLYKSIELDKNNIIAYFYLGLAFDNLSEPSNALDYYKKFINSIPKDNYGESEKVDYAKNRIEKLSK